MTINRKEEGEIWFWGKKRKRNRKFFNFIHSPNERMQARPLKQLSKIKKSEGRASTKSAERITFKRNFHAKMWSDMPLAA